MNEIATARRLMTEVEAISLKHGVKDISRVYVRLGTLCETIPDALISAFQTVAENTIASGAELRIRLADPKGFCKSCGTSVPLDTIKSRRFRCLKCGKAVCKLTSGRELDVVLIRGKKQKPIWPDPFRHRNNAFARHGFAPQEVMEKSAAPEADSA